MDISVPDREIPVINSNKIAEKSEFFVGVEKFQYLKSDFFSYNGHENEQFGKISSKYVHF